MNLSFLWLILLGSIIQLPFHETTEYVNSTDASLSVTVSIETAPGNLERLVVTNLSLSLVTEGTHILATALYFTHTQCTHTRRRKSCCQLFSHVGLWP